MFGYVKPFKPHLRMCEYDAYKAVYCGLCGQLGKSFGPAARLTLSYDFTFLSLLHLALSGEEPRFERRGCYVNPLKKLPICQENESLRFGADTATIMIYYKLLDNMHDEGNFTRIACGGLEPVARIAYKKAAASRPQCDAVIAASVKQQAELEARRVPSVDEAGEPTANAMAEIAMLLSEDEGRKRVLGRLGYFVGRFVYLCDAVDDLEEDIRHNKYNPYALRHNLDKESSSAAVKEVYPAARESIYATIAEAAKALDLLEFEPFRPILENVVFLGMRGSVEEILAKKEKIQ